MGDTCAAWRLHRQSVLRLVWCTDWVRNLLYIILWKVCKSLDWFRIVVHIRIVEFWECGRHPPTTICPSSIAVHCLQISVNHS
jgi:hypothetical protein